MVTVTDAILDTDVDTDASCDLILGKNDVICGRYKNADDHVGNRRFGIIIKNNKERYGTSLTKDDKTRVSLSVVNAVWGCGGRFLKFNPSTGEWDEMDEAGAREKVSQSLRKAYAPKPKKPVKKRKLVEPKKTTPPPMADEATVGKLLLLQQRIFKKFMKAQEYEEEKKEFGRLSRQSAKRQRLHEDQRRQQPVLNQEYWFNRRCVLEATVFERNIERHLKSPLTTPRSSHGQSRLLFPIP